MFTGIRLGSISGDRGVHSFMALSVSCKLQTSLPSLARCSDLWECRLLSTLSIEHSRSPAGSPTQRAMSTLTTHFPCHRLQSVSQPENSPVVDSRSYRDRIAPASPHHSQQSKICTKPTLSAKNSSNRAHCRCLDIRHVADRPSNGVILRRFPLSCAATGSGAPRISCRASSRFT